MKLFISYSHRNRRLVQDNLLPILRDCGHEIWRDEDDLRVGDNWQDELLNAIKTADAMVLAISPKWLKSPWCQWEYVTAIENGIQVIPVMLVRTKLPTMYQHLQYADFASIRKNQLAKDKFCADLLQKAIKIAKEKIKEMDKKKLAERAERERQSQILISNILSLRILSSSTKSGRDTTIINPALPLVAIVALGVVILAIFAIVILLLNSGNSPPPIVNTPLPTTTFTPLPTATQAPTPTSTPIPFPTPVGDSGFYVIVAGFGYQQGNQVIDPNTAPRNISNAVKGINDRVDTSLQVLEGTELLDKVIIRSEPFVGYILDSDPQARWFAAQDIAWLFNADLVVYGIVKKDGIQYIFEPSFYVNREYFEPDIFDGSSLTAEIVLTGGDTPEEPDLDRFQNRLEVIQDLISGLLHFLNAEYDDARVAFDLAIQSDESLRQEEEKGTALLYIYAGNTALRQGDYDSALNYFQTALDMNYPRAYIGLGLALFMPIRGQILTYDPVHGNEYLAQLAQDNLCRQFPPELEEVQPLQASPQEGNNVKRAFMAIDCYEEALESIERSSDIGLRALLGLGEVYEWLARGGGDFWEQSDELYLEIISIYATADPARQEKLRFWVGHAYGGHANAISHLQGEDGFSQAVCLYEKAIFLLNTDTENYYNDYNEAAIKYYQNEESSFRNYLNAHDVEIICEA